MSICKVEWCNGRARVEGYCKAHYSAFKRHGEVTRENEYNMFSPNKVNYYGSHVGILIKRRDGSEVGETLVDLEDYEKIKGMKICTIKGKYTYYAATKVDGKIFLLHVLLLGKKEGMVTDHINGNGLDNRRSNLRYCTISQNVQNSKTRRDSSTGCRGVSFYKKLGKFEAYIKHEGQRECLGFFDKFEDARSARMASEIKTFGEYSPLVSRSGRIYAQLVGG